MDAVKEIAILSGKGGTGKTSLLACFAQLAENKVLTDCDVDAADLFLILEPNILHKEDFSGGKQAEIIPEKCIACDMCIDLCRFDAIMKDGPPNDFTEQTCRVDPIACEGCGVCAWFCESEAIKFEDVVNGELYISETRHGPMVHARLGIAAENSGKLVSLLRKEARRIATEKALDHILIDGSPGIGCPVIASITGVDLIVAVCEPTLSGKHDLERVVELAEHFKLPTLLCINKYDLNPEMAKEIENWGKGKGLSVVGRIPYSPDFTQAQIRKQTLFEYNAVSDVAKEIQKCWEKVKEIVRRMKD